VLQDCQKLQGRLGRSIGEFKKGLKESEEEIKKLSEEEKEEKK
jgi:Sec-independent protein translocase protein TatA